MTIHRVSRLAHVFPVLLIVSFAALSCAAAPPGEASPTDNYGLGHDSLPRADQLTLTIFHTNDLHGHLLPFAYTQPGRAGEQPSVGGAARRATLIRRERAALDHPSLVIDAGDLVHRGPLASTYEGIPEVETLNAIGYDVAVVGNNEFRLKDGGDRLDSLGAQAAFQRLIRSSRFPWISANLRDSRRALLEGVHPFVVRRFDGVRVAFLGLSTPLTATASQAKGLSSVDAIAAAKEWIPKARAESDLLVLVSHLGLKLETELVSATTGIDAVVGGHSHTLLREAVLVKNAEGIEIPVVQTGEFGVELGRFTLCFEHGAPRGWHLATFHYDLLHVGPDLPEAADVKTLLEPYLRPLREVVAQLPTLPDDPAQAASFTLKIVADTLREATQADVAIAGYGEGLFDRFHHREVTRYDLYAILAIPHHIVTAQLSGTELAELKKTRPQLLFVGTEPLSPDLNYTVALFDSIAVNLYKLPESRLHDTGLDARESLLRFLNKPGVDLTGGHPLSSVAGPHL